MRSRGFLARSVEGANFVTSALPGIVTALALVTVAIRFARPLYQSVALVLAAYVLLFLPRALVNVRAGLAQVPPSLSEQSHVAGGQPRRDLRARHAAADRTRGRCGSRARLCRGRNRIDRDADPRSERNQYAVDALLVIGSELDYAAAAPYALIMVVLAFPVTLVLLHQSTRVAAS